MKFLILALFATISLGLSACNKSPDKGSGGGQNNPPANPPIQPQNTTDEAWKKEFPQHWWKEVPRDEAKSWEILPQDAGYMEVVLSKRNELGILSNFSDASFVFHGVCYPTVEAFWQMMKYPETENDPRWKWAKVWKHTRAEVSQMNGYAAKSAGNYANFLMDKNDANWVTFEGKVIPFAVATPAEHYSLIWEVLLEKIRQNPEVLKTLMATKDLKLIPDHGISERSPREWHYNLLWMDIRELIKKNQLSLKTSEDLRLKTCVGTR